MLRLPLIAAICALALIMATSFAGASGERVKPDVSVGQSCERNYGLAPHGSVVAGGSGWTFENGVAVVDGESAPCSTVTVRRAR